MNELGECGCHEEVSFLDCMRKGIELGDKCPGRKSYGNFDIVLGRFLHIYGNFDIVLNVFLVHVSRCSQPWYPKFAVC